MKNKFLPVILGTDANAYGMARSFYEEYGIKSLSVGKRALKETSKSKFVTVKIIDNLDDDETFIKAMQDIALEYQDYEHLILLSCAEWYTDLIVRYQKQLAKNYILPFMSKALKEKLENKESFYQICEKYNLDYPKTYIVTLENYQNLNIPFDFPMAVKPASSTEYSKVDFPGKEKSYEVHNIIELKKVINMIYQSNYQAHIIVQDFIPGDDDSMWVLNTYSNKNGQVKMMCLGHCILEEHTPYGIGNYKAIIAEGNQEIYTKTQNFLEDIGYIGYANFDLKYDYRDHKYKLFEINIRQGRSSFFVTAAGCNLAKYLIEDWILNLEKETVYNYNNHLWLGTPKSLLKKYVYNQNTLALAKQLIKSKKYSYTLLNKHDNSLYRRFWSIRIYLKDYKLFKLYPPKK